MAVTDTKKLAAEVPRPVQGVIRLWALRWALVVLLSLPALLAGLGGISSGAARLPYYTDVEGRMPVIHLARLIRDMPGAFVPALLIAIVLTILADQVLMGGALALFDPERPQGGRVKVLATVFREGLTHLWAFLRVVLIGIVLSAIGAGVVRAIMKRLSTAGDRAGWTGATMLLTLPMLGMLLMLLWFSTAGAWVFWCRLITAADRRRRVRRTGLLVLRVFARSPLRSWGMFAGLTSASMLISGVVLVAWRQAEPRSGGAILLWALAWLATMALQAFVWVWLLRSGRLLYATDRYADLRGRPDDSWSVFRRLLFWRKKQAPAPKAEPKTEAETTDEPDLPPAA
jgi:hypothetical protein